MAVGGNDEHPRRGVLCSLARSGYVVVVHACHFCGAGAPGNYAMTSLKGNPKRIGSWSRHVLAACPRCHRLLLAAGLEGRKLKATGEVWYAGHGVGRFDSPGAPSR